MHKRLVNCRQNTGLLKIKPYPVQPLSNNHDILPDPYRAVRKVLRKKHYTLSWAGRAVRGQTETIRAIQQMPLWSVYRHRQTAAPRLTLAHTMPHIKAEECFCSEKARESPFNPPDKTETQHYHSHHTSDDHPSLSPSLQQAPCYWVAYTVGTNTCGQDRYLQLWFRFGRQRRPVFPRGWRQLAWCWAWIWYHRGWTLNWHRDICCGIRLWQRWRWGR